MVPLPVDKDLLQQLMDMGFSKDAVTASLIANHNDVEQAMNALLTMDETAALQASGI